MKTSWFALAAFFAIVLMAAPSAASDPDPQTLALAQRYMAATGGTYELFQEQAYAGAKSMGDSPQTRLWQQSLQDAARNHRDDLLALDQKLAALTAQTFTQGELLVAVTFFESPAGRAITDKKTAYYAAIFTHDRPDLTLTPEENTALATYYRTPEAVSMGAKARTILGQMQALIVPVQKAIRDNAQTIYCHASRKCTGADNDFDQLGGPTLRE